MHGDPKDAAELISVPTEMEAQLIVNVLRDREIQAHAVGGFTSSFRAEAPGEVQVYVRTADLRRAQEILRQHKDES